MASLPVVPRVSGKVSAGPGSPAVVQLVKTATKHGLTEARRDAVRQTSLAEIPWWYSPHAHLAATTGIGLVVLVGSIVAITRLHARVQGA